MDKNVAMWKRILERPKCPNCGGHNTEVEKDRAPAMMSGRDLAQMISGTLKRKVDVVKCNDCHSVFQSDGASLRVK